MVNNDDMQKQKVPDELIIQYNVNCFIIPSLLVEDPMLLSPCPTIFVS